MIFEFFSPNSSDDNRCNVRCAFVLESSSSSVFNKPAAVCRSHAIFLIRLQHIFLPICRFSVRSIPYLECNHQHHVRMSEWTTHSDATTKEARLCIVPCTRLLYTAALLYNPSSRKKMVPHGFFVQRRHVMQRIVLDIIVQIWNFRNVISVLLLVIKVLLTTTK